MFCIDSAWLGLAWLAPGRTSRSFRVFQVNMSRLDIWLLSCHQTLHACVRRIISLWKAWVVLHSTFSNLVCVGKKSSTATTMMKMLLLFVVCLLTVRGLEGYMPCSVLSSPTDRGSGGIGTGTRIQYCRYDEMNEDNSDPVEQSSSSSYYTTISCDDAGILPSSSSYRSSNHTTYLNERSFSMADRSHWIVATNNIESWPSQCSTLNCTNEPTRLATIALQGRTSTSYLICLCRKCFGESGNELCVELATHSKPLSNSTTTVLRRQYARWRYPFRLCPGTVCLPTGRSIRMTAPMTSSYQQHERTDERDDANNDRTSPYFFLNATCNVTSITHVPTGP